MIHAPVAKKERKRRRDAGGIPPVSADSEGGEGDYCIRATVVREGGRRNVTYEGYGKELSILEETLEMCAKSFDPKTNKNLVCTDPQITFMNSASCHERIIVHAPPNDIKVILK